MEKGVEAAMQEQLTALSVNLIGVRRNCVFTVMKASILKVVALFGGSGW